METAAELKEITGPEWAVAVPEEENLFGMPVDDRRNPCPPEEADHWELYEEKHYWPNSYPQAFVMGHFKGYRSTSQGKTFEAMLREYRR